MFWFKTFHPETGELLEVEAAYHASWRGSRDCYGVPIEPDDPEQVVICHVWNQAGDPIGFSEFEEDLVVRGLRIARSL